MLIMKPPAIDWLRRFLSEALFVCLAATALGLLVRVSTRWEGHSISTAIPERANRPIQVNNKPRAGIDFLVIIDDVNIVFGKDATLLLVVSPSCVYCKQSADYYRMLWSDATAQAIPLIVAVPDRHEARDFVRSAGLDGAQLCTWDKINFSMSATPTLFIMDSSRLIKRLYVGQLSEQRKDKIRQLLRQPSKLAEHTPITATGEPNLDLREILQSKLRVNSMVVLDVRERSEFRFGHLDGAKNIPLIELAVRARHELNKNAMTVVDCSRLLQSRLCQLAVDRLSMEGFKNIAAFNEGVIETNACRTSPVSE